MVCRMFIWKTILHFFSNILILCIGQPNEIAVSNIEFCNVCYETKCENFQRVLASQGFICPLVTSHSSPVGGGNASKSQYTQNRKKKNLWKTIKKEQLFGTTVMMRSQFLWIPAAVWGEPWFQSATSCSADSSCCCLLRFCCNAWKEFIPRTRAPQPPPLLRLLLPHREPPRCPPASCPRRQSMKPRRRTTRSRTSTGPHPRSSSAAICE